MKKTIILLLALNFLFYLNAQQKMSRFDFKFGSGIGFMGDGDMLTLGFENDLNYKINNYLSAGILLNYGKSDHGVDIHSDYLMGGVNIFFSPFKNNKKNNFKIGTGYSFFNNTNVYEKSWDSIQGFEYTYDRRKTGGLNLIFEDEQIVYEKFLIGGKLFLNGSISGANMIGAVVKFGVLL